MCLVCIIVLKQFCEHWMLGSVFRLFAASRLLIIVHSKSAFEVLDRSTKNTVVFSLSSGVSAVLQKIGWLCLCTC